MKQGIYKISCSEETTVYIGSSIQIEKRWKEHKRRLNTNKHHNINLQEAWNAYGDEAFIFEILEETTTKEELVLGEQKWLDKYAHDCYNASLLAFNPMANPEVAKRQAISMRKTKRHNQLLKKEDVIAIKEALRDKTYSQKELAEKYEVSIRTISAIKTGLRWDYVEVEGFSEVSRGHITEDTVKSIKLALNSKKYSNKEIAAIYNQSESTISAIKRGTRWGHICTPLPLPKIRKQNKKITPLLSSTRRLTKEDVIQIKEALRDKTCTQKVLAEKFNISSTMITAIKTGRRWGHVKVEGFTEGTTKAADNAKDIIALFKKGMKISDIAKEFNYKSNNTVYSVLQSHNIPY